MAQSPAKIVVTHGGSGMPEAEWRLRRELAQTKLALYGAQNSYLQLAAEKVQAELVALGEHWIPPDAD